MHNYAPDRVEAYLVTIREHQNVGKLHLKTEMGSTFFRVSGELDVDLQSDSPEEVKKAVPMFAALRDACEEALAEYRAELAGDFARKVPELEHKRGCDTCPAPTGTTGTSGTTEPEPGEKVKPEPCVDCGFLNTSDRVIEFSKAHFNGAVLCVDCQRIRRGAATPVGTGANAF